MLGDRRATLRDFPIFEVGDERPGDGLDVNAGMVPEPLVLDGDDRVDEGLRKVLVVDENAILGRVKLSENRAVGRVDHRGQRKVANARVFERLDSAGGEEK